MPTSSKSRRPSDPSGKTVYSERSFLAAVKRSARNIGEKTLTSAFTLYNTLRDEKTPKWAKTVIGGALAYLVLPTDAIPDFLPAVGFTDDLGAVAAAAATVAAHITREHKTKAAEQVENLFSASKKKP